MFAEQQERLLQNSWGNTVGRHCIEVEQNQAALNHIWVGECLTGRDNNLSVKAVKGSNWTVIEKQNVLFEKQM